MTDENQTIEQAPTPLPVVAKARPDFFALIAQVASNPEFDATKLTAIIDANERIVRFNAESEFNTAMNMCQAEMPRVKKNGKIEFTDKNNQKRETPFAKLEDIDAVVRPIYQKHGFSVRYKTGTAQDGKPIIYCIISHIGGHTEKDELTLPLDTSGSKNNLQAMGSTISYAKRYMIENAFNIIREGADDDAKTAFPITDEQVKEITALIAETKSDLKKLLAFAGADAIEKMPSASYEKVIVMLKAKKKAPEGQTATTASLADTKTKETK